MESQELNNIYKLDLVWRNIILMIVFHIGAIYGIVLVVTECKLTTIYYVIAISIFCSFGVTCGAHRLWSHRAYKAKLPLQLFLAFWQTMSLQNDIYIWCRNHRVHHKFSETNADPHNAKRGFFFAHVGWIMCRKHPDVKEKGKFVDMSDLERDPLVMFQRKFYIPLIIFIWAIIPAFVPFYFWDETIQCSVFICIFFRDALTLNVTFLVNSAAHMWGKKPYDKEINPTECYVRHLMLGEGFHNFHHTFPWLVCFVINLQLIILKFYCEFRDYSASEYGSTKVFNPATVFINFFDKIGLAYDLKKVSKNVIKKQILKSGDMTFRPNNQIYEWLSGILSILSIPTLFVVSKYCYNYMVI